MRRFASLLLLLPLTTGASRPILPETETVNEVLKRARAEAAAAEGRVQKLEQAARRARDEALRLRARQAAAAEAIAAAEARISVADAENRILSATIAAQRQRLREQQQPVASLLAGLTMMASRPPLFALMEDASTEELVRIRLLLDASLPIIQRRAAALSREIAKEENLKRLAIVARRALARSRGDLVDKKREFTQLEAQALKSAELSGRAALNVGDVALASGEDVERLTEQIQDNRSAVNLATDLVALGLPPHRPAKPHGRLLNPPFPYRLPAEARVTEGLGEISPSGVRSRGLTLATKQGMAVTVPASGIIRFAGPFRDYDGIVIIDHGGGWISLIINVSSPLLPGKKVHAGDPLGRSLGPLGVELSHNGQHLSPALIAGSSPGLSNKRKGG